MYNYQNFDPLTIPIKNGIHLIEAGAGTGKTHAITNLYLRLLIEFSLSVENTLVLSYTNEAVINLKTKIRMIMSELLAMLIANNISPYYKEWYSRLPNKLGAKLVLETAIHYFDEAKIFTIHSFCNYILRENSLQTGLKNTWQILPDHSLILKEAVEDFWRCEFYSADQSVIQYLISNNYSPELLLKRVRMFVCKPFLLVEQPTCNTHPAELLKQLNNKFYKARDLWNQYRSDIAIILTSPKVNKIIYKPHILQSWLEAMDKYLSSSNPNNIFNNFDKFTTSKIYKVNEFIRNNYELSHQFFNICQDINDISDKIKNYFEYILLIKLIYWCNSEIHRKQNYTRILSYDDLLGVIYTEIIIKNNKELINKIQTRFPTVLIDEFQDTNFVQYAIIKKIYFSNKNVVFLVSDPRQAIYNYAENNTYLNARSEVTQIYTMHVNWRADNRLIKANNALFALYYQNPLDNITFETTKNYKQDLLWINNELEPPMQLWFIEEDTNKFNQSFLSKELAERNAVLITTTEIIKLLKMGHLGSACIGHTTEYCTPISGGDIAVLVQNYQQSLLISQSLSQAGISNIQYAPSSIFASEEAEQMEWLLAAVLDPNNKSYIRLVLLVFVANFDLNYLSKLIENEEYYNNWVDKLCNYKVLWNQYGFMHFFRLFISENHIVEQLLQYNYGKRKITNFLHLSELIHQAGYKKFMEFSLQWLQKRRVMSTLSEKEDQLRIINDNKHSVKVLTIYNSKGCEYPIVFCPFLWDSLLTNKNYVMQYDAASKDSNILNLRLGINHYEKILTKQEVLMAEKFRVFYVAITRAKQRCYIIFCKTKGTQNSPVFWFLRDQDKTCSIFDKINLVIQPVQDVINVTKILANSYNSKISFTHTDSLIPKDNKNINTHENNIKKIPYTNISKQAWKISSFTQLREQENLGKILHLPFLEQDIEVDIGNYQPKNVMPSMLNFPRGANTGRCLHKIFENVNFSKVTYTSLVNTVSSVLRKFGINQDWTFVVTDMIKHVLSTPLDTQELIVLNKIKEENCLKEFEFLYSSNSNLVATLKELFPSYNYKNSSINQKEYLLYMHGYIDLIFQASDGKFYLLDYKSNWLGPNLDFYHKDNLEIVMTSKLYTWQYLIYTVALHRYLRNRLASYEYHSHFGGVFYLFIRGISLDRNYGIYYIIPEFNLVKQLDKIIK